MRLIFLLLLTCAVPARAAQDRGVTVEVPAGWTDVTSEKKSPDILVALKGPGKSSFSLTRLATVDASNRAAVRTLLLDVLNGISAKTRLSFSEPGNLRSQTFKNGLSADYIQVELRSASAQAQPKMILALAQFRGSRLMATLMTTVPDMLLAPLLGSVQLLGASQAPAASGRAVSSDSQLELLLPPGAFARQLGESELTHGLVLGVKAPQGELWIKRIDEAGSSSKEESKNVASTLLSIPGVEPASVTAARTSHSPAGPSVLFAAARMRDSAGPTKIAAGLLPWGYWSYSIFAKGPGAEGLMEAAIAGLALGAGADPKLVAATPRLSAARGPGVWTLLAAAAAAALALGLAIRYTRK